MILLITYSSIDTKLSLFNVVNKICDIFEISAKYTLKSLMSIITYELLVFHCETQKSLMHYMIENLCQQIF